ncbi:MAG: glycosyltransferase family 39 protein [Verrucomicrobiales bacterium]
MPTTTPEQCPGPVECFCFEKALHSGGSVSLQRNPIRLPAYLAGVGSIFTVGWLAWMMGMPRAAPLASWLMALHPWIIRWGSEARGYAFELAFIGLTMGAVLAALATGKFRWWVVFGAAEVLLLISHFGSVMFLLPLNASILVILWQRSGGRPLRSAEAWSWINAPPSEPPS